MNVLPKKSKIGTNKLASEHFNIKVDSKKVENTVQCSYITGCRHSIIRILNDEPLDDNCCSKQNLFQIFYKLCTYDVCSLAHGQFWAAIAREQMESRNLHVISNHWVASWYEGCSLSNIITWYCISIMFRFLDNFVKYFAMQA